VCIDDKFCTTYKQELNNYNERQSQRGGCVSIEKRCSHIGHTDRRSFLDRWNLGNVNVNRQNTGPEEFRRRFKLPVMKSRKIASDEPADQLS